MTFVDVSMLRRGKGHDLLLLSPAPLESPDLPIHGGARARRKALSFEGFITLSATMRVSSVWPPLSRSFFLFRLHVAHLPSSIHRPSSPTMSFIRAMFFDVFLPPLNSAKSGPRVSFLQLSRGGQERDVVNSRRSSLFRDAHLALHVNSRENARATGHEFPSTKTHVFSFYSRVKLIFVSFNSKSTCQLPSPCSLILSSPPPILCWFAIIIAAQCGKRDECETPKLALFHFFIHLRSFTITYDDGGNAESA